MGNLSQTDKHNPQVHTMQPNPEQTNQPLKPPAPHDPHPLKKDFEEKEEAEQRKTGTR